MPDDTVREKRTKWVRMDKIIPEVLNEAHERQLEETMRALEDGPEKFYKAGGEQP